MGDDLIWKSEITYLGVILIAAKSLRYNLQRVRQKYFRALNSIFGKIGTNSSPFVTLSLINSYCIPLLAYGSEAFSLTTAMYNTLENAYSAAFSRIFRSYDASVIKQCQFFSGFLPLQFVLDKRKLNFFYGMFRLNNISVQLLSNLNKSLEYDKLYTKYCISSNNSIRTSLWTAFEAQVST